MFDIIATYRCCGTETSFDLGYMAWEDNKILRPFNAVPDSCCLIQTSGCGHDIFKDHSLKKMAEYVKRIHVHGCLHAMDQVLKVSQNISQLFVYISLPVAETRGHDPVGVCLLGSRPGCCRAARGCAGLLSSFDHRG